MELLDRTCVVTGATEGIGRAITFALVAEGARLAVCARTVQAVEALIRELREGGGTAAGAPCDVSNEAEVEAFAALVRDQLGPVDVLVNNAGLAHFGPVIETSGDDVLRYHDARYKVFHRMYEDQLAYRDLMRGTT